MEAMETLIWLADAPASERVRISILGDGGPFLRLCRKMATAEVKGKDAQVDKTKRRFLDEWAKAVNAHGGFGTWCGDISRDAADVFHG
jgi:hypothetical protein